MKEVVIVSGARTAIGSYNGALQAKSVVDLGSVVLKAALDRAGLRPISSENTLRFTPQPLQRDDRIDLETSYYDYADSLQPVEIDQVYMGNVLGAGQGQNVARQSMVRAGLPKETCATTINKLCASGMEAVAFAYQAIRSGDADVVLAGGMENMSRVPYGLPDARWGQRMGDGSLVDLMVHDGLYEIFYGYHMGITAENIAQAYQISRQEQDELGALSHQRARAAQSAGLFADEIVEVEIPQRGGVISRVDSDERPMDTSVEKMSGLRPAFKKDGTVTAGNASGINDGAAALLIMSAEKAEELKLKGLVKIVAHASAGLDPAYMGLGPIPAIGRLMQRSSRTVADFDTIELNEAFAAQAIACMRELALDPEKTNPQGSGISLGHPIGCTGARILVSLMYRLVREDQDLGLASLCIGGGQGMAMALQRC